MMCADAASSSPRASALRAFPCALKGGLEQHTNALFRLGYSVEAFLEAGVLDDACEYLRRQRRTGSRSLAGARLAQALLQQVLVHCCVRSARCSFCAAAQRLDLERCRLSAAGVGYKCGQFPKVLQSRS